LQKRQLRIVKAQHTGFCFGVKRAIKIAEDILKKNKKSCSIGSIIHNPAVVKDLSKRGLRVISDIKDAKGSCLVIRSHGISPRIRQEAKRLSIRMVDATCPFVKRSHDIVTSLKAEGYFIVIAGENNHPEVKALAEAAKGSCVIAAKILDLKKPEIKRRKKIAVVAQTTLSHAEFFKIVSSVLQENSHEYRVFDTICNDVTQRQSEAGLLAKKVDVILVVGGKNSANTKRLCRICKEAGARTYHIEDDREIKHIWFRGKRSVGIVSGASTPQEIVERVVKRLKK